MGRHAKTGKTTTTIDLHGSEGPPPDAPEANGGTHRRNHYVPKCMLKGWEVQERQRYGVHLYDIRTEQFSFAGSRGRPPFEFAVIEDLYVPTIDNQRVTDMEAGWMAGLERVLATLLREVSGRRPLSFKTSQELTQLETALVAMELRSRHNIDLWQRAIERDPEARHLVTVFPDRPVHRIVLENLLTVVEVIRRELSPMEMEFFHAPTGSEFVVGDRPILSNDEKPIRLAVLTPKVAMHLRRSMSGARFRHWDAPTDLVETINRLMAGNARDWLISRDRVVLEKYAAITRTDEWRKNRNQDRAIYVDPPPGMMAWHFREPGPRSGNAKSLVRPIAMPRRQKCDGYAIRPGDDPHGYCRPEIRGA